VDIPVNAQVQCADGPYGRTDRVVINPATRQVTHLVVKDGRLGSEYLVPIEQVIETTPALVRLGCTREEIEKQAPFVETMLLSGAVPFYTLWAWRVSFVAA